MSKNGLILTFLSIVLVFYYVLFNSTQFQAVKLLFLMIFYNFTEEVYDLPYIRHMKNGKSKSANYLQNSPKMGIVMLKTCENIIFDLIQSY